MNNSDTLARAAISAVVAMGLAAAGGLAMAGGQAQTAKGDLEKCAGIVKAGKNDCATSTNSCAASSTKDGDKEAWIFVPKGTCEKIVGGQLLADAKKKK